MTGAGQKDVQHSVPKDFLFIGVDVASAPSPQSVKSWVMKDHYRRKRDAASIKNAIRNSTRQQTPTTPLAGADPALLPARSHEQQATDGDDSRSVTSNQTMSLSVDGQYLPDSQELHGKQHRNKRHRLSTRMDLQPEAPNRSIHVDPFFDLSKHLDLESREHFKRYFFMANELLDVTYDTLTCKNYNFPLAQRFPVLISAFTAFSSRQTEKRRGTPTRLSLHHHNSMVKMVNAELENPTKANYDTILLGIQGAMGSAFAHEDMNEFSIHKRGQASFLQRHGLPEDPDVMLHIIANSFMYGKTGINALLEQAQVASIYDRRKQVTTFCKSADELCHILSTIHMKHISATNSHPMAHWSLSQQRLFQKGSLLYSILHDPAPASSKYDLWRKHVRIGDFPYLLYLIIYMILLVADVESTPLYHQEELYAGVIDALKQAKIQRRNGAVTAPWTMLVKFKHDRDRMWQAHLLMQVVQRLGERSEKQVLDTMLWKLCPEDGGAVLNQFEIDSVRIEAVAGL